MENKHGKLFVIKQSEGCKFVPKMHQNTFGGWAPTGPARGELMEGLLLRGRREGKGRGPTYKGMKGEFLILREPQWKKR